MTSSPTSITQNQIDVEISTLYLPDQEKVFLALLMKYPELIVEAMRWIRRDWLYCCNGVNTKIFDIMVHIHQQSIQYNFPVSYNPSALMQAVRQCGDYYIKVFYESNQGMEQVISIETYSHHVAKEQFMTTVLQIMDTANRVAIYKTSREAQMAVQDRSKVAKASDYAFMLSTGFVDIALNGYGAKKNSMSLLHKADIEVCRMARICATTNDNLVNLHLGHMPKLMNLLGGGISREGVLFVTARTKVGKSTWAQNCTIQAGMMQNVPTLILDSEMSMKKFYSRSLASVSQLNEGDILKGRWYSAAQDECQMTQDEITRFQTSIYALRKAPIYYMNIAGLSPEDVAGVIRQFKNRYVGSKEYIDPKDGSRHLFSNPGLVIYDWVKLDEESIDGNKKEYQMLGFLMSALHQASIENNLPIIALGQNNRQGAAVKNVTDWEDEAELMAGGTDRLSHFCSAHLILRNLGREEIEYVSQHQASIPQEHQVNRPPTPEGYNGIHPNSLRFNQAMHLILNRNGPEYRSGIPLYLNRGMASHTEMGDDTSIKLFRSFGASKKLKSVHNKAAFTGTQTMVNANEDPLK